MDCIPTQIRTAIVLTLLPLTIVLGIPYLLVRTLVIRPGRRIYRNVRLTIASRRTLRAWKKQGLTFPYYEPTTHKVCIVTGLPARDRHHVDYRTDTCVWVTRAVHDQITRLHRSTNLTPLQATYAVWAAARDE